jgi:hypothetical protein
MSSNRRLDRFLSTDGTASGTKEVTGDYSVTKDYFYIQPPQDQIYRITRMIVYIRDGTGGAAEDYGNIANGLANGMRLEIRDENGISHDFFDGIDVQNNADWSRFCYDTTQKSWGAGDEMFPSRWSFDRADEPIILDGRIAERLTVVAQDNLTGLVSHTFMCQGQWGWNGTVTETPAALKPFGVEPV